MRNWALAARPASFRGAHFYVDGEAPERGRRVAVHEISGGEQSVTEDMGRRNPRFRIDAYIASDVADIEGLALERACEIAGPALLFLPFDAPVMAHCENCRRDRRKDRAGYYGYSLDFVLAGMGSGGMASPIGALRNVFSDMRASVSGALAGLF